MRQVTHALLTRPPLSHKIFISEENQIECFVRLACVKHAASVHPEPGSNSHVKSFFPPELIWQLIRNNVLIYCFKVASLIEAFLNYSQNLSRFFTVQLSRFFALLLSRISRSAWLYYHDVNPLSTLFYIFFKNIFKRSGEGGIWTLAPLLTTCTLSRGVPSASLGTSPNKAAQIISKNILAID